MAGKWKLGLVAAALAVSASIPAVASTDFGALKNVAPEAMSAAEMDAVRGQVTIDQLIAAVNACTTLTTAQKTLLLSAINANKTNINAALALLAKYKVTY